MGELRRDVRIYIYVYACSMHGKASTKPLYTYISAPGDDVRERMELYSSGKHSLQQHEYLHREQKRLSVCLSVCVSICIASESVSREKKAETVSDWPQKLGFFSFFSQMVLSIFSVQLA